MPQKDETLLRALIEKYAKMYAAYAVRHGMDFEDAEEIVMEAFWTFYQSKYYGALSEDKTKAVIATIVKNKCIDHYRKTRSTKENTVSTEEEDVSGVRAPAKYEPEQIFFRKESEKHVREILEDLKPIWRDVMIPHVLEGRTHAEISKALGISEDMCRSRISRAKKHLRNKYGDELFGDLGGTLVD